MQSTTVTVTGKGSNPKTILYVGGLEEDVTEDLLKAAFIPFGPIKESNIPLDNETGKNRGFGFVQYEEREDAADAIDNMHNAELQGRCVSQAPAWPLSLQFAPMERCSGTTCCLHVCVKLCRNECSHCYIVGARRLSMPCVRVSLRRCHDTAPHTGSH